MKNDHKSDFRKSCIKRLEFTSLFLKYYRKFIPVSEQPSGDDLFLAILHIVLKYLHLFSLKLKIIKFFNLVFIRRESD